MAGGDTPITGVAELYDPSTGTFTTTGGMAVPRRQHFASLLGDGRVVIVGGADAEFAGIEEVETYDPLTGVFEAGGTVTEVRYRAISMLPSGRVLVVSGLEGEIYDPETGDTVAGYTPLGSPKSHGLLLHDGTVLMTSDEHTQIFEEESDAFSWGPELLAKRSWPSTTELPDGRILVAGGVPPDPPVGEVGTQVIDLDEGTNAGPDVATGRVSHSALLNSDGRVLIAGGSDSLETDMIDATTLERYVGPALRSPINDNMAALLPDGRVLAAGTDQVASSLDPRAWTSRAGNVRFAIPRYGHTATLLPNSGEVVFIGGAREGFNSYVTAVEIYNPATKQMRVFGRTNERRTMHTATLLSTGRILLVGGWTKEDAKHTWELFNPSTGVTETAGTLLYARSFHQATLLPDGRVLITGGAESPMMEVWDPNTQETASVAELLTNVYFHDATLVPDGRVLVTGGRPPEVEINLKTTQWIDPSTWAVTMGPDMNYVRGGHSARWYDMHNRIIAVSSATHIEELDLAQGTWEKAIIDQGPCVESTVTLLPSGKILHAGSLFGKYESAMAQASLYDPSNRSIEYREMLVARGAHTATLTSDHELLVAGGMAGTQLPVSRSLELFDTEVETFSGVEPAFRPNLSATLLPTGNLLLAGGRGRPPALHSPPPEGVTECDLWDPVTERARKTAEMTVPRAGHTTTLLNDRAVLIAGGTASVMDPSQEAVSIPSNSVEIFGPSDESFTAAPSMQVARSSHSATRLMSGEILIVGGTDHPTCEIFDPAAGAFRSTGSLQHPRSKHAAVLTTRGQVVVAGGESPSGEPVRSIEVFDPQENQFELLPMESPAGGRTVGVTESSGRLVFMGTGLSYTLDPSLAATPLGLAGAPRIPAAIVTLATGGLALCGDEGETANRFSCVHLQPGSNTTSPMFDKDGTEGSAVARLASGELWVGTIEAVGDPMMDVFSQTDSAASRPAVTQYPERIRVNEPAVLQGYGFASHPAFTGPAPMPGIVPSIALLPANGGPPVPCTIESWTDTSLSFTPSQTAFHGPAWLHVVVHGVPSEGKFVLLQPLDSASPCSIDAACASGHCVEGVCCDTSCTDPCLSCLAAHKGGGEDGVCGPVSEGTDPKEGCDEQPPEACGTTGVCDGNGACAWTPEGTPCGESRLCLAHDCTPTLGEPCQTSAECAGDQVCGPNGTCERETHESEMVDPGGGCSCRSSTPPPSRWAWIVTLALLGLVVRRHARSEPPKT